MNNATIYESLCDEEKRLLEALDKFQDLQTKLRVIQEAKKAYEKPIVYTFPAINPKAMDIEVTNKAPFEKPKSYKEAILNQQKAYWALKSIEKGTYKAVAEKLRELDPETFSTEKKSTDAASFNLSWLYRNGVIGASPLGRGYEYYIFLTDK